MISSPRTQRRIVIPRWRSLASTLKSQELGDGLKGAPLLQTLPLEPELIRRLEAWRKAPDEVTAARVVETALVTHRENEGGKPARLLVRDDAKVTAAVKKQATLLLKRIEGHSEEEPSIQNQARQAIAKWRKRTRISPGDSLAWVELALGHAVAHQTNQALDAMKVALQLAPTNRHVLRSAARLLLHAGDGEKAHDIIRRSPIAPTDPWLIAAEIAFAQKLGRTPQFLRRGLTVISENRFVARQTTELSSAIATAYLFEGNAKRSKRHFLESVADPTGNSLAQAEWASPNFAQSLVPPTRLLGQDVSEACSMHCFMAGDFEQSFEFAKRWVREEPYSSRAYLAAAMAASVLDDYTQAADYAKQGLAFDPQSRHLRNHLAFSLASSGQLEEAEAALGDVADYTSHGTLRLIAQANKGLIAFRREEIDSAKSFYRKAIAGFKSAGEWRLHKSAQAYFAREAILARIPEATELLAEARDKLTKSDNPVAARVVESAERILDSQTF